LGIGVGATTAIFSVVNGVLLRPLPYPDAERLVNVWQVNHDWFESPNQGLRSWASSFPLSMPVLRDWEELNSVFESVGGYDDRRFVLTAGDQPEVVYGTHLTSATWRALGVPPYLGRTFLRSDDEVGAAPVAVLGHGFWETKLGGDPAAVGTTVLLNGVSYEIVGVMPPEFYFPSTGNSNVWVPFPDDEKADDRGSQFFFSLARLKEGITIAQAQREMDILTDRLVESRGHDPDHGVRVVSRIREVVGDVQLILLVLLGAVAVVLLIACANITNMLLVRATERRRELAIRAAMGAWRGRLLRQFLSESLVLSIAGGVAGGLLAFVCFGPLMALLPSGLPRADEVTLDIRVFLFLAATSVGTGLLVGSLPAFRAARADVAEMLQGGGRGVAGARRQNRTQGLLVVSEVALAFVLLFGATLLVKSFVRLTSVKRGFDAESVLTFDLNINAEALARPSQSSSSQRPRESESGQAVLQHYVRMLEDELRAIPGVFLVATADNAPFLGGTSSSTMTVESFSGMQETNLERGLATPPYFRLMGVPIISGRAFAPDDRVGSERVVIVSRGAADQYWPGEDPVGRRLRYGGLESGSPWRTIVGVAEDVHHQGLDVKPRPKVYLPYFQVPRGSIDVLMKTNVDPELVVGNVRDVVQRFDPTVPAPRIRELERVVHASVAAPRFRTRLVSMFAVLAGLLAVIGVYGVLAYSMAQRSAEIGVKMALGASAPRVLKTVLLRGGVFAAAGLAVGVAVSLSAVRVLDSFLFDTNVHDPFAFVLAALLLAVAALFASYIPARRATKIDPVEALRAE